MAGKWSNMEFETEEEERVGFPEFITGSWEWSGPWLMCDRVIARNQDLPDIAYEGAPFCPICLSDDTIRLSPYRSKFAYCFHCRNCGLVWLSYPVRCPEHYEVALKNLHCYKCNYGWDEELIKQMHEKGW